MLWWFMPLAFINPMFPLPGSAQNRPFEDKNLDGSPTIPISDLIEKSAEIVDPDQDQADLVEELTELSAHPLNLNAASEEELGRIPFLTAGERKGLADYLKNYGELLSVYELQSVPGFDSLLIQQIEIGRAHV